MTALVLIHVAISLIAVVTGFLVMFGMLSSNRMPGMTRIFLVTTILTTPDLRADWEAELEAVRNGMIALREALAAELAALSRSTRSGFLAEPRGMFPRLGARPEQFEGMRAEHGIYMVGDSRINIAGLNAGTVPLLARAMIGAGV